MSTPLGYLVIVSLPTKDNELTEHGNLTSSQLSTIIALMALTTRLEPKKIKLTLG